ncbi:MAG: phosphonate ABC transporter ATP-binding protein [Nitrospinales bacterium]
MLQVQKLAKIYPNGARALDEISFEVAGGEFVVVLGKSGAGKSSLLRCINRLVEPSGGRIVFRGREITGANAHDLRIRRRKIAMIFQNYNLVKRCSVLTNVLCGRLGYTSSWAGLVNHFSRRDVHRAAQNLERLGIADTAHRRADTLSGGQQQRVGIARALMQEPSLILADEPVSSLDPAMATTILDILKRINEQDGVTIVCNLHIPDLGKQYASRIIALKNGGKIFDGPPGEFDEAVARETYANS